MSSLHDRIVEGEGTQEHPFVIHTSIQGYSSTIQKEIIDRIFGEGSWSLVSTNGYESSRGESRNRDLLEIIVSTNGKEESVWFDLYIVSKLVNNPVLLKAKKDFLKSAAVKESVVNLFSSRLISKPIIKKEEEKASGPESGPSLMEIRFEAFFPILLIIACGATSSLKNLSLSVDQIPLLWPLFLRYATAHALGVILFFLTGAILRIPLVFSSNLLIRGAIKVLSFISGILALGVSTLIFHLSSDINLPNWTILIILASELIGYSLILLVDNLNIISNPIFKSILLGKKLLFIEKYKKDNGISGTLWVERFVKNDEEIRQSLQRQAGQ